MNNPFQDAFKALSDEPTIGKLKESYPSTFIDRGLHVYLYPHVDSLALQFTGWELVLLKDGTYFINDTSGG